MPARGPSADPAFDVPRIQATLPPARPNAPIAARRLIAPTEELVSLAGSQTKKVAPRKAAPKISAPALGDLAEKLSDELDTRVLVELGRRKGKITIEFASIDDLERIVAVMAPKLATVRKPAVS